MADYIGIAPGSSVPVRRVGSMPELLRTAVSCAFGSMRRTWPVPHVVGATGRYSTEANDGDAAGPR
jgi:hypothetical protein